VLSSMDLTYGLRQGCHHAHPFIALRDAGFPTEDKAETGQRKSARTYWREFDQKAMRNAQHITTKSTTAHHTKARTRLAAIAYGGGGGGGGGRGDALAAICGSSTASGRRPLHITPGLVTYSRSRSTSAFKSPAKKVCIPIPVGVQGRELAHKVLGSQITLLWNYQRSPFTSNVSPSRRDQHLLVFVTKRAAAKPIWLVARRGSINTAQGPGIRRSHEVCMPSETWLPQKGP